MLFRHEPEPKYASSAAKKLAMNRLCDTKTLTETLLISPSSAALVVHANAANNAADSEDNRILSYVVLASAQHLRLANANKLRYL